MSGMDSAEVRSMIGAAVEREVGTRLREITGRIAALEARVAAATAPEGGAAPVATEPAESVVSVDNSDAVAAVPGGGGAPVPPEPAESMDVAPGPRQRRLSRTLDFTDVEEDAAKEWTYQVQNSIWDAALFIGVPAVGSAGSAFLVIGLACNLLLQLIFATVLSTSFGKMKGLPSTEDAWEWRESEGHWFSNMVTATRTSLVRATCSGQVATLAASPWQHDLYTMINDYTAPETLTGIPLGAMLCAAVLFSWALIICQELNNLWAFARSVLSLPRADETKVLLTEGELSLASCTLRRKCFVAVLLLVRCWIALCLLIYGSMWLARTVSIVDLVLNAAALAFVMGMDELIFETLAPLPTRLLVRDLRPLPRPRGAVWRGVTLGVPANLGAAILAVSLFFGVYVLPNLAQMGDVAEAVCGGFRDFVVSDTDLDLLIATGTTNPYGQRRERSFSRQAVRDVINLGDAEETNKVLNVARYEDFHGMVQAPVAEVLDGLSSQVLAKCSDYDMSAPGAIDTFRATLQNAIGVPVGACADAAGHCHGESRLLRLVCPATCGCDDPHSGLYKNREREGCPRRLCDATAAYASRLSAIPCRDYGVPELSGMPGWGTIVTQWAAYWGEVQPSARGLFQSAAPMLLAQGCGALDLLPARVRSMLCSTDAQFGSIKPYCPSTCGCASEYSPECPTQCIDMST